MNAVIIYCGAAIVAELQGAPWWVPWFMLVLAVATDNIEKWKKDRDREQRMQP